MRTDKTIFLCVIGERPAMELRRSIREMKSKLWSHVAEINKELILIFSIIASAGLINLFIGGQRLILTFYNIPIAFAAYYLGRRQAVQGLRLDPVCYLGEYEQPDDSR